MSLIKRSPNELGLLFVLGTGVEVGTIKEGDKESTNKLWLAGYSEDDGIVIGTVLSLPRFLTLSWCDGKTSQTLCWPSLLRATASFEGVSETKVLRRFLCDFSCFTTSTFLVASVTTASSSGSDLIFFCFFSFFPRFSSISSLELSYSAVSLNLLF